MIDALFIVCALALPATSFTRPPIVSWQAASNEEEEKALRDWLRKNNPDAEVFIHEAPQTDKLKEYGWERVPFNWKGKQIWIKRKPADDKKKLQASA